jgi:type IV pilus biogenesis protein PilP
MADPNNFSSLPTKQKVSAIVFFIIGAVVIWQAIGLFRGGSSKTAEITPDKSAATSANHPAPGSSPNPASGSSASQKMMSNSPSKPGATPPSVNMQPTPAAGHGGNSPILSKPTAEVGTPPSTPINNQQQQEQVKYVSAINQLQMLKIQKEIAETNQAIVAAKLATAEAERSMTEALTPSVPIPNPANSPPPTPAAVSGGASGSSASSDASASSSISDTYIVYSVSMELDQWHAVIGFKDKLYNVMVGDIIPNDGSIVSAIDAKGVTLKLAGMERRIPFSIADVSLPSQPTAEGVTSPKVTPALSAPPPPAN